MADILIGVIGAGGMGSRHVLNLQHNVKGARVAAIYDLDQTRAQQVAAEYRCLHSILTEWHTGISVNAGETESLSGTGAARRSTCQLRRLS